MKKLFYLTFFLFSLSCSENNNKIRVKIPEFDSTAYYDSLFAGARYSIDTFFTNKHAINEFNGNVLFAYKGKIILKKSFGFKDPHDSIPLEINNQFQIASITKTFTSTAILQLVEQGKLKLTDSVHAYIDSFPYKGITVEMLLCHRGGLSKYEYYCDDYWSDKYTPISNDDVVEIMKKYQPKPYHVPDRTFEYSNTGFILLSKIIEKVSGKKYREYLKENIFEPVGMKNTFVYDKSAISSSEKVLKGFTGKEREVEDSYLNGVTGDKGIYTTVEDLFLYDRALRAYKILSKKYQKMAYKPTSKEREEEGKDNYGYGWRLKSSHNGYSIVYHTGWWKGFRGNFIRNMSKDFTIITLDNVKRGPFISVEQLLDLVENIKEPEKKKTKKKNNIHGFH